MSDKNEVSDKNEDGSGFLILLAIGILLSSLPVYLLWNWLAPVFGVKMITFMQAVGLKVLCHFLLKTHWVFSID